MSDLAARAGIRLFAVTDVTQFPDCIEQAAELCSSALPGSVALVLRERGTPGRQLFEWAKHLRDVTSRSGQRLFVADRLDLALLVGADGVHLPSFGLPASLVPSEMALEVSRSAHSLDSLTHEDWKRISYFWVSPVVAPRKGRAPLGEAGLRNLVQMIGGHAPQAAVHALGGITSRDVPACERAGAAGVAAMGTAWERQGRQKLLQALAIDR